MYPKKPLFSNRQVQATFEKDGFVKIKLLDEVQVATLVDCYERHRKAHEAVSALHHTTTDTQNPDVILEVDTLIKTVFETELNKHMCNYKPLVGCFHIKEKGDGSATGIHQDPTFVDESQFISANIWVALHNMNTSNGNMYFVKGSHKVSSALRTVPECPVFFQSYSEALREAAIEVPMQAGEAVIFSNATIHGATDNQTNQRRLAATLLVCSVDAQWQIYFNDSSRISQPIEQYELNLDTFIHMPKNGKPAETALKGKTDYVFPVISEQEFYIQSGYSKPNHQTITSHWFTKWLNKFLHHETAV